jgi:glycine/D-amino acid oxidase-like deaminating enzyme
MVRVAAPSCDALIIGAGFYGCEIALELKRLGFEKVVLVEREPGILRRASFVNQARVHNGYHYPRSLPTAERSRANFEAFVAEYAHAIYGDMRSIYAIARNSRVSATQFEAFCRTVGLPCYPVPLSIAHLFESDLIEAAFFTEELVFNSTLLAERLEFQLADAEIDLRLGAEAQIVCIDDHGAAVRVSDVVEYPAFVFNCTYAELEFAGIPLATRVKKELTEIALIDPPQDLKPFGVTVMDGPFFSIMPFPPAGMHSLSHVRYTPHEASTAQTREVLVPMASNRNAMIRDAQRYLPCLRQTMTVRSIFDIKATLIHNEDDDGRPILIEQAEDMPRVLSVLGSKIDNIYDVRAFLRSKSWAQSI